MRNHLLFPLPSPENDRAVDVDKPRAAKPAGTVDRPVTVPELVKPFAAPPPAALTSRTTAATTIDNGNWLGPRKLVRPKLPPRPLGSRYAGSRNDQPEMAHHAVLTAAAALNQESSHAEAFYFQKQVQMQTPLVFVLEDGEQVQGIIEWYDRNVLKVKNSGRVLIYKSSIKYLYKAGENHPGT